ncbi:MAG: hypothetical protein IT559_03600 [Alphaproteobacteria bacterium]|nr:hypothetical protein [Alphaproteobacteria bacterium]
MSTHTDNKTIDQSLINGLYKQILAGEDTNPATTLSILKNLDKNSVSNLPTAILIEPPKKNDETIHSQSLLPLYPWAVFNGAAKTSHFLLKEKHNLDNPADPSNITHPTKGNKSCLIPGITFGPHTLCLDIQSDNDLLWAILSRKEDALKNTIENHTSENIPYQDKLSAKTNSFASVENLSSQSDKLYTPLDVALIFYISQRSIEKRYEKKVSQKLSQLFEGLKTKPAPEKNGSQRTENKIIELINLGGRSSGTAYFPADEETAIQPFSEDNGCFEAMSLEQFCADNANLISPRLKEKLTAPQKPAAQITFNA